MTATSYPFPSATGGKASCDPFRGVPVSVQRRCVGGEVGVLQRLLELARIRRIDQYVRADTHGVDPLRARPKGDARDAEPVRLLLEASGVGHDARRGGDEREHLEVAEGCDRLEG